MDLDKYRYLIKIAELQSITKASKELFVSQPALTKYINNIEEKLGVKLFDRHSIPIKLTYAGERYIDGLKRLMQVQNSIDKEMEEISESNRGRIRIGITSNRAALWLPYIIPKFRELYPNVEIKLVEGSFSFFEEQMIQGELDISFAALPIYSSLIDYETISFNKIVLVGNSSHSIFKGEDIKNNSLKNVLVLDPKKLDNQPFVSLNKGQGLNRTMWQIFELHNITPGDIIYTSNTNTMYNLASAGIGFAFVTDICIKYTLPSMEPIFCTIDEPQLMRENVISYKKGGYLSTNAKNFIKLTREIINSHPYFNLD